MPYEEIDEQPEDSEFRFVVLGHPELGEFLSWEVAVAKAWEVTPPGAERVEIVLAQKGVIQVRTEDADDDQNEPGWIVIDTQPTFRHSVSFFGSDWQAVTHCGQHAERNQWSTYNSVFDGDLLECEGCKLVTHDISAYGATVLDLDHSAKLVHLVERAHLSFVQFHCGRITSRSSLVAVRRPKKNECGVCFDPDYDGPPKPASWP